MKESPWHKIVETDNFGGDYPDEKAINLPPMRKEIAESIANEINKHLSGDTCSRYWKVEPMEYELQPGFEP